MNQGNSVSPGDNKQEGEQFTHDLIVIGSGPAGMSAACVATEHGLRTLVLDEQPRAGGQIYRNVTVASRTVKELLGPDYRHGASLAKRYANCDAEIRNGTLVWDVARDLTVTAQTAGKSFNVRAPQLILATGAMERPSPLPGWTLPGVMNAGAAQIALKTAAQVPNGKVVLVGSGPLLLLVACQLLDGGADIAGIIETSPACNTSKALKHLPLAATCPAILGKGLRMLWRLGRADIRFVKHAEDVRIEPSDDGQRMSAVSFLEKGVRERIEANVALLHHGVVPNTQITRLLRVDHLWSDQQLAWHPVTDAWGQTSLSGLRIAGDGAAIAGALAAEASGAIAAIGAAMAIGKVDEKRGADLAKPWRHWLKHQQRVRPFLDALYRPPEWLVNCADETVICRCEEVTAGRVREMAALGCEGPNQTKFFSRCGMGPCQGRMCAITVTQILADAHHRTPDEIGSYRIRAPIKPISLGSLAALGNFVNQTKQRKERNS